jgi:hypothetical protein
MGQTSVPETLVTHQKFTPGYNPQTFKQQLDTLSAHLECELLVHRTLELGSLWYHKGSLNISEYNETTNERLVE